MKNINSSAQLLKLVFSSACLALAMLLPLLTGQLPEIGNMLCPMHIPILLCGFICGWPYGLVVGLIAPIIRSFLFGGFPPLFPTAVAMSFELCAYGALSGLMHKLMPKKISYTYLSLVISMISGRLIWGAVMLIISGLSDSAFGFAAFWSSAIVTAIPGIILQILLIPLLIFALKKAKLVLD